MSSLRVIVGDARSELETLDAESVQSIVTSPPYWQLRDYGDARQTGLEANPQAFVDALVAVFRSARRVLARSGTLWLNLGDTYGGSRKGTTGKTSKLTNPRRYEDANIPRLAKDGKARTGLKRKDLAGIPWRVALALQADGWYLRSEIIWSKACPTPEAMLDRPTRSHEHVFLLSRSLRYQYNPDPLRTPLRPKTLTTYGSTRRSKGTDALGRVASEGFAQRMPERKPKVDGAGRVVGANARTVWSIAPTQYDGDHYSTFPIELPTRCILAGTQPGQTVLDPFAGTGTTLEAAIRNGRHAVGIELVARTAGLIEERLRGIQLPLIA